MPEQGEPNNPDQRDENLSPLVGARWSGSTQQGEAMEIRELALEYMRADVVKDRERRIEIVSELCRMGGVFVVLFCQTVVSNSPNHEAASQNLTILANRMARKTGVEL